MQAWFELGSLHLAQIFIAPSLNFSFNHIEITSANLKGSYEDLSKDYPLVPEFLEDLFGLETVEEEYDLLEEKNIVSPLDSNLELTVEYENTFSENENSNIEEHVTILDVSDFWGESSGLYEEKNNEDLFVGKSEEYFFVV